MNTTTGHTAITGDAAITTPEGVFRLRAQHTEHVSEDDNPRGFDGNIGVLVLGHQRRTLPSEGDLTGRIGEVLSDSRYGDKAADRVRAVAAWLMIEHGTPVVLPVWGYDHGELRLSADAERKYPFDDRFDSGLAGIVYADPEALAEHGLLDSDVATIAETLAEEVRLYDKYLNNDLYEYVIDRRVGDPQDDDEEWEEVDRLGVYFSEQEALEMGLHAVPGAQDWHATEAVIVASSTDFTPDADEARPVQVALADGNAYQAWHVTSPATEGRDVGRYLMAVYTPVDADPATGKREGWVPVDRPTDVTYPTSGEATAAALRWIRATFGPDTPTAGDTADAN